MELDFIYKLLYSEPIAELSFASYDPRRADNATSESRYIDDQNQCVCALPCWEHVTVGS